MKYKDYQVEDFIVDLDFIRWVLEPQDQDKLFWNRWIAENPDKKPMIEEARLMVMSLRNSANTTAYSQQTLQQSKSHVLAIIRKRKYTDYIQWAAVITLLVTSAFLLLWYFNSSQLMQYSTAYAETKEVSLPDGSRVTLNANSKLKVVEYWQNNGKREVWLDGEAFFEVKEKIYDDQPLKFIIHTESGIDVTVLGTSFNVNDRNGQAEVVLNHGKVKISNTSLPEAILLQPGELVSYQSHSGKIVKKKVDPTLYTGWTNKQLRFNDQPLSLIIERIEILFGLEVKFQNFDPQGKRFTGATPYQDVEILLLTIAKAYGLEYEKQENKIIMNKK